MKINMLLFALFTITTGVAQTKLVTVDCSVPVGSGKKMTGVNTGPQSVVSGTTAACLETIGNELIRTHDYHGPCDYWAYTDFFNYTLQKFNYAFQSHLPTGYHWASTDDQIAEIIHSGFQPFFRLGISFPGGGISPASPMPKDSDAINFKTFAGIAKRTAMHYTAGWDHGFNHSIPYWEIWNEPNHKASWDFDSVEAYYRLYRACADSIKSFDPHLKVGGPAAAKNAFYNGGNQYTLNQNYLSNFLKYCKENETPLDFYSFHMYDRPNPYNLRMLADTLSYYLNLYGFANTELILSENNNNTGGYTNTSKGCSYLTSELISLVNSRLSKFIWYRGVDLSPLCDADDGTHPNLTLNGYAYKFFNELNDSTPILIKSAGNEFNARNLSDSLNNVMILSGKNTSDTEVKVLVSNHESVYSDLSITLNNLPWHSSDHVAIFTETVSASGYQTKTTSTAGGSSITYHVPDIRDASVFLISFKKLTTTSTTSPLQTVSGKIYPNPAHDIVTVQSNFDHYDLTMMNAFGQVFLQQADLKEIDLRAFPNGLYHLCLRNDVGLVENYRLVVQK
ncbi:MAG: hypothetical protein JPMHGGIA_01685 [Saprospiraceae bacterium]|nr:hypothetical protein [Saprospiraceae bacterium]